MNPVFNDFDQDILQQSLKVMRLQDILITASPDTIDSIGFEIYNSFLVGDYKPIDFVYSIFAINRYRSLLCRHLTKVTLKVFSLLKKAEKNEMINELKTLLFKAFFFPLDYESNSHIFIYFCKENGVFTKQEVCKQIHHYYRHKNCYLRFYFKFIIWMAPELEEYNKEFFKEVSKALENLSFFQEIEVYKKEKWKLHKFLCQNGFFPDSIEEIIYKDDLEEFIKIYKNPIINYSTKIQNHFFYHSHVISHQSNLIQLAVFYSSVKIFKFLLNFVENISELQTSRFPGVDYLSMFSGNFEIIKACDDFGVPLSIAPQCATCFYRHELLSWLIESKNFSPNHDSNNYGTLLCQAGSANNIRSLFYLIEKGADVDLQSMNQITPLYFSVEFNKYHTVRLLSTCSKIHNFKSFLGYQLYLKSDINVFRFIESRITLDDHLLHQININILKFVKDIEVFDLFLDNLKRINYLFVFLQSFEKIDNFDVFKLIYEKGIMGKLTYKMVFELSNHNKKYFSYLFKNEEFTKDEINVTLLILCGILHEQPLSTFEEYTKKISIQTIMHNSMLINLINTQFCDSKYRYIFDIFVWSKKEFLIIYLFWSLFLLFYGVFINKLYLE
ncbi:hypothetical protein TRFO_33595 [Tritrichomonas foetus]|uniref:Uncharacterized protein n=1 Tax=Tritrichomonas foetus TaxID=1144522 RepID=A0A1J4JL74_9EUKA|nr:hypothetical protein TRFO_33595 [Tritrichomonas foetus]|eukprot:OHS99846.1 hypothetical protein TRFO_33595 [Tritrichomonas foetus]